MEHLCLGLMSGILSLAVVFVLLVILLMQKQSRKNAKRKETQALNGIAAGIGERLHAVYPSSKWRWVCSPVGFAVNGGIARIEVIDASGTQYFMDVCLSENGYMALHKLNAVELPVMYTALSPKNQEETANELNPLDPASVIKPNDKESVEKWYNIVLIDTLTTLINDLNANGEACLFIGKDGKAYVEENGSNSAVYDFGELPSVDLWGFITEKLSNSGLFAEVQEESRIFISWV
ncbi:MAG: hypothetical protein FWG87_01515 [Defluviitaleaceae bacterium]|nr:hypothetical protein [Defluviitaleaceae bacterium]